MPNYKLTYFNGRGRAEVIRLLFHAGKVPFEDVRITKDEWPELKPTTPLGTLPFLEVDGHKLGQSLAIARYVAKKAGLAGKTDLEEAEADAYIDEIDDMILPIMAIDYEEDEAFQKHLKTIAEESAPKHLARFEARLKNNKYLVGSQITWADVVLFTILKHPYFDALNLGQKYPGVVAHGKLIAAHPGIKEWLRDRPVTEF